MNELGKCTHQSTTERHQLTVLGEVVALDLRNQTCQIQMPDGLSITSDLDSNFPDSKQLSNATPVEVTGIFEINDDGLLTGIVGQSTTRLANLNLIELNEFRVQNE